MLFFKFVLLVGLSRSQEIFESGVNSDDAKLIINKHNELRLLVAQGKVPKQPQAADLKRMKYDSKLAETAQKIADTCIYAHSKVDDDRWKDVGQSLYRSVSKRVLLGSEWNRAIEKWFKEHHIYSYSPNPKPATAHYTQLVGAKVEYVGCGYSLCKLGHSPNHTKLYVCNYGPLANYEDKYPYKAGQGCENLC